jgi:predicted nucleic acid-binding protein
MSVFVDTSVWYAAADSSDVDNRKAKRLINVGEPLVVSDHVLAETWTLLCVRLGRKRAEQFWEHLRSGVAALEFVGPADLEMAWHIGVDWPDQEFSLIDRTSFAVMRRLGIERVASLDHHFAVFRFGPQRRRAFTVLG